DATLAVRVYGWLVVAELELAGRFPAPNRHNRARRDEYYAPCLVPIQRARQVGCGLRRRRSDIPCAQAAGPVNAKRHVPSLLEAEIDPPCASTIDFAIARPRPAPTPSYLRDASTR